VTSRSGRSDARMMRAARKAGVHALPACAHVARSCRRGDRRPASVVGKAENPPPHQKALLELLVLGKVSLGFFFREKSGRLSPSSRVLP